MLDSTKVKVYEEKSPRSPRIVEATVCSRYNGQLPRHHYSYQKSPAFSSVQALIPDVPDVKLSLALVSDEYGLHPNEYGLLLRFHSTAISDSSKLRNSISWLEAEITTCKYIANKFATFV